MALATTAPVRNYSRLGPSLGTPVWRSKAGIEPYRQAAEAKLQIGLLGPFSVALGRQAVLYWPRPPAKRLCELVLISPKGRILKDTACDALFPDLEPPKAALALTKALSLARATISGLGGTRAFLQADRTHIWVDRSALEETDYEAHAKALQRALDAEPGNRRDDLLTLALRSTGTLLEDEPYATWALRAREHLDWLRQEASLTLARDRANGHGHCDPHSVIKAWEQCYDGDPTCEEAACALMRAYSAQGRPLLVEVTYKRCRTALQGLGLETSPVLNEVHQTAAHTLSSRGTGRTVTRHSNDHCHVTALVAEIVSSPAAHRSVGSDELDYVVEEALSELIAKVAAFGGTATAVSGTGLVALFGAPEAHEDDAERALQAAFTATTNADSETSIVSLRIGVETGHANVGTIGCGQTTHYVAVGEAVATAASLQREAMPASVLVGPAARAATEGLFDWGPRREVCIGPEAKAVQASCLQRPRPRPSQLAAHTVRWGRVPLIGRASELSVVAEAVTEVTAGQGGVIVISGARGLGKTRLVEESRSLFMEWVGAGPGRLPLWMEANAVSYGRTISFGLYRRLLSAWLGVGHGDGEGAIRSTLGRMLKALSLGIGCQDYIDLLADLLRAGPEMENRGPQAVPKQLQIAPLQAMRAVVFGLMQHGPTVLVLEDLQWADPASLQLTSELCPIAKEGPLLLVLTRRNQVPDGSPALEAALLADPKVRVRRLELSSLGSSQELEFLRALIGEADASVFDIVRNGAEGNPRLLQERATSVLQDKAAVDAENGCLL